MKNETLPPGDVCERNFNILLVEDDHVNQLVAGKMLNKWGFQVTVATNGKEALEMITSKKFQMVLMDMHMPEMDGGEATRRIRAMEDPYFKTLPILAFSAFVENKESAIQLGMTDYASKPLNPTELQTKITKYLMETTTQTPSVRKLSVDFDTYTEGDQLFKHELIHLMIGNVVELQQSLPNGQLPDEREIFHKALHKVKPTIGILNDPALTDIVEKLKELDTKDKLYDGIADTFHKLCTEVIQALKNEIEVDNGAHISLTARAA